MAIESPEYDVEQRYNGFEVRRYAPQLVAQVVAAGTLRQAGRSGFQVLAGYIFGRNRGTRGQPAGAQTPIKLAMTAPVTLRRSGDGYLVRFFLPKATSLASAPEPIDPAVQLRQSDGGRFAVIRYSGRWSQAHDDRQLDRLQQRLTEAGLRWVGEPIIARYNPPFTPWFLRRNEIWLELMTRSPDS